MKILIVNRHREDSLGGSELQCDFIASELTKRGHLVRHLAMMGEKDDYGRDYEVFPCDSTPQAIISQLKEYEPDVIYWRFNKRHFYEVAKFANSQNIKFIFSASHIIDLKPWKLNKKVGVRSYLKIMFKRFKNHRGFKYIDALVVNNKDFLNIIDAPEQMFIPNGMTQESVSFTWNKPFCIWVANIKELKRPELYIDLAREFSSSGIDFLMVGAIQEKSYQWFREGRGFPENLHYLGPKTVEEVNGILDSALFHIHTCYVEGFPNIFIQAWMQSIPSITYSFDPSGYLKENNIGYSADEDWGTFVKLTKKFIEDVGDREKKGENARVFAEEVFDIEKSVSKLENLMLSIT